MHLNISMGTINYWSILYSDNIINKYFLTTYNMIKKLHGLNKKKEYESAIIEYVNNNEGCTLNDIIKNVTNTLSKSSICRLLKENNISRKRIRNRIVCKDINKIMIERNNFANNLNSNDFNNYISIDESSFCISDVKLYGYSKKNKEIKKIYKHKHNKERYSILTAISNNKIVGYKIYQGSLNANGYLDFIKDHKTEFENKTLLQDNVRLHHSLVVKEYAQNNNISMKYIPAYTPEFNPIEQVFSQIKSHYRNFNHDNIEEDIIQSLMLVSSEQLTNYFRNTLQFIETYRNI